MIKLYSFTTASTASLSLLVFPYDLSAWIAAIAWGVYCYALHETISEEKGDERANQAVLAIGVAVSTYLGLTMAHPLMVLLGFLAVSSAWALRFILPQHFPQSA